MFEFKILKKDKKTRGRLGLLKTPHGVIHTPAFVPVSTRGALRGIGFDSVREYGAEIFMVNTFHFFHNDRYKIVQKFGGLHAFMGADFPLMTDSGGFQVFSLGLGAEHGVGKIVGFFPGTDASPVPDPGRNFIKIKEEGIWFSSPYDGRKLFMSPEISIEIQQKLGADIIFAFDECTSPLSGYEYTKESLKRTAGWAIRSLRAFKGRNQALMGIVQGGEYKDLRKEAALFLSELPFFGYGIGGSLGKTKVNMVQVLDWTIPLLPEQKPLHLLGMGEPDDFFIGVERGVDTFDCVIPTRWARHGSAITYGGRIDFRSKKYLSDRSPLDPSCRCRVCKTCTRAYVSHLLKEHEMYGIMLLVEHNLAWVLKLMKDIRTSLKEGSFLILKKKVLKDYYAKKRMT